MKLQLCWLISVLIVSGVNLGEARPEPGPSPEPNPKPSFWDAVPVVSQAKMAFLYVIGDSEEAEETWSNFKNLTHLWENVKDMDNSIPGYGHVKALIVSLNGDEERAIDILLSAHKSTFIMGGFILGGPAGAIGGSITADTLSTLALRRPVGIVDHVVHFKNKTAGEHIDAVLDLTVLATPSLIKGKSIARETSHHSVRFDMKKTKFISSENIPIGDKSPSIKSPLIESPQMTQRRLLIEAEEKANTPKKSETSLHPDSARNVQSPNPPPNTPQAPKRVSITDALVKLELQDQRNLAKKQSIK